MSESAVPEIDVAELARRREAGAMVYDVREPKEFAQGHVPEAVLIPLGEVPDRVADFGDAGAEALVICRSGGRSLKACEFLRAQGLDAVNIAGGTIAWIAAGHPVEP